MNRLDAEDQFKELNEAYDAVRRGAAQRIMIVRHGSLRAGGGSPTEAAATSTSRDLFGGGFGMGDISAPSSAGGPPRAYARKAVTWAWGPAPDAGGSIGQEGDRTIAWAPCGLAKGWASAPDGREITLPRLPRP